MALGGSLIVAIGLQNAFILRQGLKNRHIFPSVLTASLVDVLLIGSSTWGQGDPQRDWVDPLYEMDNDEPDMSGKKVAFFGAGDQDTHGEFFVSALGKMEDIFKKCGAETGFGYWPTEGYDFKFSDAKRDDKFCGLPIDDVNQEDLTSTRIIAWAEQVKSEMGL
mgnify:CR=1 FL=1